MGCGLCHVRLLYLPVHLRARDGGKLGRAGLQFSLVRVETGDSPGQARLQCQMASDKTWSRPFQVGSEQPLAMCKI